MNRILYDTLNLVSDKIAQTVIISYSNLKFYRILNVILYKKN
jgi:hypothetical protein